ncbi:hypothetical protein C8R47DRAFT_1111265 [Mycena vitilis]|nr:hypothetical protein C8R47DRAFT_1111265 [Mycena vitilis]
MFDVSHPPLSRLAGTGSRLTLGFLSALASLLLSRIGNADLSTGSNLSPPRLAHASLTGPFFLFSCVGRVFCTLFGSPFSALSIARLIASRLPLRGNQPIQKEGVVRAASSMCPANTYLSQYDSAGA